MHKIATPRYSEEQKRLEEEVASLRKRLSAQHAETRVEQKNNELLRTEIAVLKSQLGQLEKRDSTPPPSTTGSDGGRPSQWPALQKANSRHAEEVERLKADHRAELDRQRAHHASEIANLKKSLLSPKASASDDDSEKLREFEAKYEARLDALRKRLKDAEQENGTTRASELEAELDVLRQSLSAANEALARAQDELAASKVTVSAPQNTVVPAAKESHDMARRGQDDLTRLKGVGPAIAQSLRKLGITTFAQVAAWSADDVETIAPKVRTTAGKIKKNKWIESARELASSSTLLD